MLEFLHCFNFYTFDVLMSNVKLAQNAKLISMCFFNARESDAKSIMRLIITDLCKIRIFINTLSVSLSFLHQTIFQRKVPLQ